MTSRWQADGSHQCTAFWVWSSAGIAAAELMAANRFHAFQHVSAMVWPSFIQGPLRNPRNPRLIMFNPLSHFWRKSVHARSGSSSSGDMEYLLEWNTRWRSPSALLTFMSRMSEADPSPQDSPVMRMAVVLLSSLSAILIVWRVDQNSYRVLLDWKDRGRRRKVCLVLFTTL